MNRPEVENDKYASKKSTQPSFLHLSNQQNTSFNNKLNLHPLKNFDDDNSENTMLKNKKILEDLDISPILPRNNLNLKTFKIRQNLESSDLNKKSQKQMDPKSDLSFNDPDSG